jgi:hypothetical protein
MKKLTEHKKELIKEFVDYKCEQCNKKFPSEELQIHRIRRGCEGGIYELRNIKVLCKAHHKLYHYKEFR